MYLSVGLVCESVFQKIAMKDLETFPERVCGGVIFCKFADLQNQLSHFSKNIREKKVCLGIGYDLLLIFCYFFHVVMI